VEAYDVVNFVLGGLYIVLALVLARYVVRLGRVFPWLVLLVVLFLVRGTDRVYGAITDAERLGILVDVALVAVLVALVLSFGRTSGALKATHDAAALREEEYERALGDFRRLARHRLANPIAAIRGSILTLRDLPDLDEETRRQLLDAVDEEARRLEKIALDPEPAGPEERGLDAQPRL
jgi:signal transduction histidine kinase